MLRFIKSVSKWYAETPSGELAFGDNQGLYEWRNGRRIHYTGGDQCHVHNGEMLTTHANSEPYVQGIKAALDMKARIN